MPFLDEILGILPNSVQELKAQCIRHGVEDYPQVELLLIDTKLSSGLHRDWRKAVFRLLDNIFARFKLHTKHTHDRLDAKIFPFTSYYCPLLLSHVLEDSAHNVGNDADLKRDRAAIMQEDIQQVISTHQGWSRIEVLIRCLSSYEDLEAICLKLEESLNDAQLAMWSEFAKCLRIADKYDMARKVYQSLDQDDVWNDIKQLSFADRGEVLNLWQFTIDTGSGESGNLKRAMFKMVKETCTLPNNMILSNITLESSEAVHGGGCADIFKAIWGDSLVALKVLRIFNRDELNAVYRELCKEAIVWSQLKHENVAPFLGLCKSLFPNRVALVAPWMSNGDLSSYLSRNPNADRVTFAVQIASGMKYLHSQDPQIIHGDLRANNVLVDENLDALITDFGISKVNVVQTKLSVQSNRGSARWQAPELHYNEEGLSHVTTKSDVYAYGMTCFEIFTNTIPFAHLTSDGMVIMEILQKKSKPRRPPDPLVEKRGLTDRLWALLEDCWAFDARDRPSMDEVTTIVRNESRFIAKEREQLKLRAVAPANEDATVENSSGGQVTSDEGKIETDDGTRPVLHSPIKVSLELRLDENEQHLHTAAFPTQVSSNLPQYAPTETNSADTMGQFISRGRYHPTVSHDSGDTKLDPVTTLGREHQSSSRNTDNDASFLSLRSGLGPRVHPNAPGIAHELSDSSIITRSSMSTTFSKSSELSYQTMFTSPENSPAQEKKDSLNSLLSSGDERDTLTDGIVSSDSADNNTQRILADIRRSHIGYKQARVSSSSPESKPNSLIADAVKTYALQTSQGTWVDSPKSNLQSLPDPTDTRTSVLLNSRSSSSDSVPNGSVLNTKHILRVPIVTESAPFSSGREGDSNPLNIDESQAESNYGRFDTLGEKQTNTSIAVMRGAETRAQNQRAPTSSPMQGTETIIKFSESNEEGQPRGERQGAHDMDSIVVPSPRLPVRKLKNRMGAIKVVYKTYDEGSVIPSAVRRGTPVFGLSPEPNGEPDVDPWELNDPAPPNDYESDMPDPLQTEEQMEEEPLLECAVVDLDEQKKQLLDFESIIDDEVRDFFEKRDLDNARTYFIALPAEYRYKLIARLAIQAILSNDDEDIDALFVAELFDRCAENGSPIWCSVSDYEKASRLVVQELHTKAFVDSSVASRRLDVILEGTELSEAFKSSMLRQLHKASSSPQDMIIRNVGRGTPSMIITHNTLSNSTFNKVKID